MKRFFKTAMVFLVVTAALSLFIHYIIIPHLSLTPYFWGDKLIIEKHDAVLQQPDVNAIFFGSSMVYRQINPVIFDSTVKQKTGIEIHSFNFGVNWLAASEMLYLSENLLKETRGKFKYVFLELQRIKMVNYKNYLTTRTIYWYSPAWYGFTSSAIFNSRLPLISKTGQWVSHTVNFTGNQINLGYFTEAFRFQSEWNRKGFYRSAEEVGNGFLSLDDENRQMLEAGLLPERFKRFLKDTTAVYARKRASISAFTHFENHPEDLKNFNKVYAQKLNAWIEEYKKQNIYLLVFLPPRLDRLQYHELLPILNALPEKHRINLADGRKYPEFYLAANSADVTHMNEKGATLYSRAFADNFVLLLQAEE
jgi:hypothetical protein